MSLFFQPPSHLTSSSSTSTGPSLSIRPTQLPTLSAIYLQPLSHSSSLLAQSSPHSLVSALSNKLGRIVRTGDVISIPPPPISSSSSSSASNLLAFRVVMTEPVLMGLVGLPQEHHDGATETEIIVGPSASSAADEEPSSSHPPPHHPRNSSPSSLSDSSDRTIQPNDSSHSSEYDSSPEEDDFDDDFEISASFLQQALLGPPSSFSTHSSTSSSPSPAFLPPSITSSHPRLVARALKRPLRRQGGEREDESVAWVKTRVLGEIGAFDGDWVAIRAEDASEDGTSVAPSPAGDWRIVRICAREEVEREEANDTESTSSIHLPPLLLHSLSPLVSHHDSPRILVLSTPFPPSTRPPLPTAMSVTLARVASPASTNKLLQAQVVRALRKYFDSGDGTGIRALKVGDMFGVGVDEFDVVEEGSEGEEEDHAEEGPTQAQRTSPTTAVCFVVTHVDLPPPSTPSAPCHHDTWDRKASRGDFGSFVDPSVTQLVQAGVWRGTGVGGTFPVWIGISGLLSLSASLAPARELQQIVSSSLVPSMGSYDLQLSVLIKGARGSGKRTIVRSVAAASGLGVMEVNCFDIIGETDIKTEGILRARFERVSSCSPCVLLLRNVEALARKGQVLETGKEPQIATVLRECIDALSTVWRSSGFPVLVVATTSDSEKVPLGILACFKREISLEAPDERQRLDILTTVLASTPVAADVDLGSIAVQTAALVAQDIVSLVARAKRAAVQRLQTLGSANDSSLHSYALAGVALAASDFLTAIDDARTAYSQSIGAPKIPNVSWDDVGGLANVKTEILDTIEVPLNHPELFAAGLKKRSGILLYGPPGTGKTLLAKAVATSCSLNFFSVKGPELLNMYIGESEANVRRVFQRARDAKPCVIFFDELDSVAPKRGNQGDSGGVMDRIVSQLLAELDGMTEGKGGGGADVFVIGATNRPDLLDPALLRPGRFDRMLYLGVSDTHDSQRKILEALTRKFKLDPALDLAVVASQCPFNYTGADFYALCSDAMLKAMSRKAEAIDANLVSLNAQPPDPNSPHPYPLTPQYYLSEIATEEEIAVLVGVADFEDALRELVPSVSGAEMEHYRRVQAQFSPPVAAEVVKDSEADGMNGAVVVNGSGMGKGKGKLRA